MGCINIQEENLLMYPRGISCFREPKGSPLYPLYDKKRPAPNLLLRESPAGYAPRYLDLRGDFVFKYVFGKKGHKDLLLDFLNSVFEGRKVICDVRMSPPNTWAKNQVPGKCFLTFCAPTTKASSSWLKCSATVRIFSPVGRCTTPSV